MAEKSFRPKLAAIIDVDGKCCSICIADNEVATIQFCQRFRSLQIILLLRNS
jgi:hypothetical protein